jgi:hypothetical protein
MKFVCSYAYEVSCYRDFVVEAKSKLAAQRKLNNALSEGKFDAVDAEPFWENTSNARAFIQGPATQHSTSVTMEELIGEKHLFNSITKKCVHCGRDAEDDAVEEKPCRPH